MNALIRSQKNTFSWNYGTCVGVPSKYSRHYSKAYKSGRHYKNDRNISRQTLVTSLRNNHHVHPAVSANLLHIFSPSFSENFLEPYDVAICRPRYFSIGSRLPDTPSSKVEVTVQTIKNKQKEEELKKEGTQESQVTKTAEKVVKKSLKARIWHEVLHYYHGFRLLFIDINICRKLLWQLATGHTLTRRENRLLVRTTADLFRLVPFSIFIIVPFMEFTLPIFLKFFPGMLPSTFQTAMDREDKLKKNFQMKLEVAKFLQKTLGEMAVHNKDEKSDEVKDFTQFFQKIKNPNEFVSKEDIIKFSKHFDDEIMLDSLSRDQLIALCRILELNTIGPSYLLKFIITMKLRNLAADDRLIQREGVDSLNLYELQQACKARGMRAYGLSEKKMRLQLQEWIDLNITEKVPPTLLLLSRALMVPDTTPTTDKLKATISKLPDVVATQTKAAIGEREGKIDNKTKIEIVKEEVRKIKEEREERKIIEKEEERKKAEILADTAPVISDTTGITEPKVLVKPKPTISSQDVEVLSEALTSLPDDKKLLVAKETIKDLKEEIEDYKEDVQELREITTTTSEKQPSPVQETTAAKILLKKVDKMVSKLDKVLQDVEKQEKKLREAIPATKEESAKSAATAEKQNQLVRIDELVKAIRKLQKVKNEARLQTIEKVLSKIDADGDGNVKIDAVLKIVEFMGKDDVHIDESQLDEIIELLNKEEHLQAEEKIQKALLKSMEKKQKTDELKDPAPIVQDKATDLSVNENVNTSEKDGVSNESIMITPEMCKEAAEKQKEKILPSSKTDIPPTIPPPPIPPPTQANSKDKML